MSYKGTWNALTNTPVLSAPEPSGNYYVVSSNGATLLGGVSEWNMGDWIISTGTEWQKVDNSEKYPIDDLNVSNASTYSSLKTENQLGAHLLNTNSRLEFNADLQAISGNHAIKYFTSATELPPGWDAPAYNISSYTNGQLPLGLDTDIANGFQGFSISPPTNHTEFYIWGTTTAISFKSFMLNVRLNASQIFKFTINGVDIGLTSQDGTATWIKYSAKDLILSPTLFPSLLVENTAQRFAIHVKKNQGRLYCGVRMFGETSQKLSQISDVVVTTPVTSQALVFNGTNWTNQTSLHSVTNIGTVNSIVGTTTAGNTTLKGLLGNSYLTVTSGVNDLTLAVPKITSNTIQVSDGGTGWKIVDGGGLSFQNNAQGKFVVASNATFASGFPSGASTSVFLIPSGTTSQRSNTIAGIRYNTTTLAFEFYNGSWIAPTQNNSFSSVQGSDLNISGAVADQILGYTGSVWAPRNQSTNLSVGSGIATLKSTVLNGVSQYRSILAGANTNVTLVADDIVISSSGGGSGEVNTAIGQGVGATIVGTKVGTVIGFKNLLQGSGIAISSNATDLTISSTIVPGETNTAIGLGNGVSVVAAKIGPVLGFKNIIQGSGISITNDAVDITISSTVSAGEVNTASSAGGTVSLVNTKVGVNLPFKGLTAGTNVTLTQNANDVVINATSGGAATTISIDPACPFISAFLAGSNYTLSARAAETIRIGLNAGGVSGTQNFGGVSIGDNSGKTSGVENLYFGPSAGGGTSSKSSGMALGILSGYNSLGTRATVIGFQSGFNATGDDSVAIGPYSGYSGTQPFTISIGNRANFSAPNVACIVINATSVALNGLNTTPGCFITPVANKTQAPESLYYNNTTKEVTFQKAGQQPSYTTAQRTALTGLTAGFLCYDSDLLQLGLWSGIAWRMI
jgi:hypothetical protein